MKAANVSSVGDWTRRHWDRIKRAFTLLFIALVVGMLGVLVTKVHWDQVWNAILAYRAGQLGLAASIVAASYLVYSSFDLLGKWYTDHSMAWWRGMLVGAVCYAFTMNFGAPVGGVGMRLRLYTKMGLKQGIAMRIMGLSLTTNWMGYALLAGAVFLTGKVRLPTGWEMGEGPFRILGAVMLAAGVCYVLLCAFSKTRAWNVRGHEIELPSLPLAIIQMALAILNWCLMAAVIFSLLPPEADYLVVLGTLLVSAIAGIIAHIPGGIGVLESVFVALLTPDMPRSQVLGAMFVYRALYYLAPLLVAGLAYAVMEAKIRPPKHLHMEARRQGRGPRG